MTSPQPFFSIVCPTFNRASFLAIAIKSVVDQTYQDWELIIIDDGSTDNSAEIVSSFKDERIHYHFQENQERSASRNKGIKFSRGRFICLLDSDDYFEANHLGGLEKKITEMNFTEAVYYSGYQKVDLRRHRNLPKELEQINHKENSHAVPVRVPLCPFNAQDPVGSLLSCTIYPSTTCASRNIYKKYLFNTELRIWEDTFLWLNISKEFPFIAVEKHSAFIVFHPENTSSELTDSKDFDSVNRDIDRKVGLLKSKDLKAHVNSRHIKEAAKTWIYHAFYNAFLKSDRKLCLRFFLQYVKLDPLAALNKSTARMLLDIFRT